MVQNGQKRPSNGLKWPQNAFLGDLHPFCGAFWLVPPSFWGDLGARRVKRRPQMGPKSHFACGPHVGQKFPKMPFFGPKNRAMQKNISTMAHICCQTPCGTTGRSKTPFLVNFWQFWPFSGFFACRNVILAFSAILVFSGVSTHDHLV